ncbi:MAG: hypothetical protein ACREAE_00085, partial [Nitrosopumilaceae archaeon]
ILASAIVMFVANLSDPETRMLITDVAYVPTTAILMILSIMMAIRFRTKGQHAKAWILFVCFTSSWFIAEQLWLVYELVYKIDPWPSMADFFYLAGYPLLVTFSIFYLKPVKKAISRKLVISAVTISGVLLIPTLYIASGPNSEISNFEVALASSYPILDALILCPAIIGVTLFFKGEVNFLWSLICAATILNVIADTGFLVLSIDDSYYTGHPIDLLYLWAYILFAFGVYSHMKIFKSRINDPYEDADALR